MILYTGYYGIAKLYVTEVPDAIKFTNLCIAAIPGAELPQHWKCRVQYTIHATSIFTQCGCILYFVQLIHRFRAANVIIHIVSSDIFQPAAPICESEEPPESFALIVRCRRLATVGVCAHCRNAVGISSRMRLSIKATMT